MCNKKISDEYDTTLKRENNVTNTVEKTYEREKNEKRIRRCGRKT